MTLVPASTVFTYIAGSMLISYAIWDLTRQRKIFGGTVPRTLTKEWQQATLQKFDEGWPRVAGPPVVMNPQSRQNYKLISQQE